MELKLGVDDLVNTRFALSPLWEVVASVRVLKVPQQHLLHRPWVEKVRPRLAQLDEDFALLRDLVPVPTRTLPAFLAPHRVRLSPT